MTPLVGVDASDRVLRLHSWDECHRGAGILHRAISVFVFNSEGRVLLQKRSREKKLWPGYWSNACCTHPKPSEAHEAAAERRLSEELGLTCQVERLFRFQYRAEYHAVGCEYELCTVFAARTDMPLTLNEREVSEVRWVSPGRLDALAAADWFPLSPWARLEWQILQATARGSSWSVSL